MGLGHAQPGQSSFGWTQSQLIGPSSYCHATPFATGQTYLNLLVTVPPHPSG